MVEKNEPMTAVQVCLAMGSMTARELKELADRIEGGREGTGLGAVTDNALVACAEGAEDWLREQGEEPA